MKANCIARRSAPLAVSILVLALTASCSPPPVKRAPAPPPVTAAPRPVPPPPLSPRPATTWRDAPITPGNWSWAMEGGRSMARFGGGLLVLRCDRGAGLVTLLRQGAGNMGAGRDVAMSILTTTITRTLYGNTSGDPAPAIAATFSSGDGLLDAMAFSRGRFAVETAGLPTLYVPSWPEVSRVIEDCR